jgi:hypothetical protein
LLFLCVGRRLNATPPGTIRSVPTHSGCVMVYIPDGAEILDVPLVTAIDFRRKKRGA